MNSSSGDMVLVGEKSNKVVSFECFSRSCSLCLRHGFLNHDGPCNSNFENTAKSMEPAGIVACFKDLQQRSSEISEIILDNDGNTIDAINSTGFYPKITRDRNHTMKNLTGKIMKIFPTKSNTRDYFLKRLKDPLTYGRDSQWLSKYYSAVVDHSSGDHSNCTDTCSKGAAKPFFGKLAEWALFKTFRSNCTYPSFFNGSTSPFRTWGKTLQDVHRRRSQSTYSRTPKDSSK